MSTEKEKNELKSQGAVEAAQDPNSSVTGKDATRVIVEESKKAGSAALQFDPNASPEEKAAQARAVRDLASPFCGKTISLTFSPAAEQYWSSSQRCGCRYGYSEYYYGLVAHGISTSD